MPLGFLCEYHSKGFLVLLYDRITKKIAFVLAQIPACFRAFRLFAHFTTDVFVHVEQALTTV